VIEPQVEETPAAVADAPDTTTQKQMHEDPSKLDQSGDEAVEKKSGSRRSSSSKPSGSRAAKAPKQEAAPAEESTPRKRPARRTKKDES
jgi:hypothetical protein